MFYKYNNHYVRYSRYISSQVIIKRNFLTIGQTVFGSKLVRIIDLLYDLITRKRHRLWLISISTILPKLSSLRNCETNFYVTKVYLIHGCVKHVGKNATTCTIVTT